MRCCRCSGGTVDICIMHSSLLQQGVPGTALEAVQASLQGQGGSNNSSSWQCWCASGASSCRSGSGHLFSGQWAARSYRLCQPGLSQTVGCMVAAVLGCFESVAGWWLRVSPWSLDHPWLSCCWQTAHALLSCNWVFADSTQCVLRLRRLFW